MTTMTTTTKTTARKATHSGECQCCGRQQKLPSGRLSNHGYTVEWGFFSGVCYGAGHLPYEQDCSLVKAAGERATQQLATLEQDIADLRKNDNPDDVRHEVYGPVGRGKRGYQTYTGKVTTTQQTIEHPGAGTTYTFNTWWFEYASGNETKRDKLETYERGETLAATALKMNNAFADKLERRAAQIKTYIGWCAKRVADWQPRELKPISE